MHNITSISQSQKGRAVSKFYIHWEMSVFISYSFLTDPGCLVNWYYQQCTVNAWYSLQYLKFIRVKKLLGFLFIMRHSHFTWGFIRESGCVLVSRMHSSFIALQSDVYFKLIKAKQFVRHFSRRESCCVVVARMHLLCIILLVISQKVKHLACFRFLKDISMLKGWRIFRYFIH